MLLASPSAVAASAVKLYNGQEDVTGKAVTVNQTQYAQLAAPLKNISPHKLRSTFGTNLYRETGDIYLVADVLGHKDVNTTRKHYAATSQDNRRIAAHVIKLRED